MTYIAYKTSSLYKEVTKKGFNIDAFQNYIKNNKGENLYFEQLLLVFKDMYNSNFHLEVDNKFKTADSKGETIILILISDYNDSVGGWQGIELMIAAKYKAEIYLVDNCLFVAQMLNGIKNKKTIIEALNYKKYRRII